MVDAICVLKSGDMLGCVVAASVSSVQDQYWTASFYGGRSMTPSSAVLHSDEQPSKQTPLSKTREQPSGPGKWPYHYQPHQVEMYRSLYLQSCKKELAHCRCARTNHRSSRRQLPLSARRSFIIVFPHYFHSSSRKESSA